jgi:acetylornithine deacetylase/succinyl-diaminopimelate desuccinylase-like protein
MYDLLRNRALSLSERAVDLTRELVQTASPSLREHPVAGVVERAMREYGFDRVVRDDHGNVVGVMFGLEPGPTLLLIAHMDTVLADGVQGGTHDPLSGKSENGRVSGLGAADCKGGIASQLFAAVALKRSILPLRGNLVVAATVAEENGAALGVRALLTHTLPDLGLVPEYAVLGEPTNLGLYYGHDGWAELAVRVEGHDLFQVTDAGRAVFEDFSQRGAGGSVENGKQNVSVTAPVFSHEQGTPTAVVRVTRRLLQGQPLDDVIAQTKYSASAAVRATGAVGVEVDLAQERQQLGTGQTETVSRVTRPWCTDPWSPLVERAHQALLAAECTTRPGQWTLDRLGMGTAGGALVHEFHIPTLGYGPGNEKAAHAADEYVDTHNLSEAIYGTASIAHALIGVPVYGWTSDEI